MEGSPLDGLGLGIELIAVLIVADAETFVVRNVPDAGEGDDVFVSSMALKVCVFGLSSLLL